MLVADYFMKPMIDGLSADPNSTATVIAKIRLFESAIVIQGANVSQMASDACVALARSAQAVLHTLDVYDLEKRGRIR